LISPGAVIGLAFARLTDRSFVVWGIVGGLVIWAAAVGVERLLYGRRQSRLSFSPPLTDAQLDEVAEAARYAGIKFEHQVDNLEDSASVFTLKTKYHKRLKAIVHKKIEGDR